VTPLTLRASPDGWTLEVTASSPDLPWAAFILRGLAVTREQAVQVLYLNRGRAGPWSRFPAPGGWIMTLELDREEAHAIWRLGHDPLTVLAPPLYARSLTLREMMR
jgi:hypothetical protein